MALDFPAPPAVGGTWTAPTGVVYVWDGTKWATQGGGGGGGSPLVEPVGPGTWGRLETGAWERGVATAGDTMSGALVAGTVTKNVTIDPAANNPTVAFTVPGGRASLMQALNALVVRSNNTDAAVFSDMNTTISSGQLRINLPNGSQVMYVAAGTMSLKNNAGANVLVATAGNLQTVNPAGVSYLSLVSTGSPGSTIVGMIGLNNIWQIQMPNNVPMSGANVGADFGIVRYPDGGGAPIDQPFTINRATGIANFTFRPTVQGAPIAMADALDELTARVSALETA
jgi:hypothetical protein